MSKPISNTSRIIDIEEAQELRKQRRSALVEKKNKRALTAQEKAEKEREKREAEEIARARKSFVTGRRIVFFIVIVVLLIFAGLKATELIDLRGEAAEAQKDLETKNEQKARLEKELSLIGSAEYIEKQARERLRMVKPGEIIYLFPGASEGETSGDNSSSNDTAESGSSGNDASKSAENED